MRGEFVGLGRPRLSGNTTKTTATCPVPNPPANGCDLSNRRVSVARTHALHRCYPVTSPPPPPPHHHHQPALNMDHVVFFCMARGSAFLQPRPLACNSFLGKGQRILNASAFQIPMRRGMARGEFW